mgnify:CR=1 FL=1
MLYFKDSFFYCFVLGVKKNKKSDEWIAYFHTKISSQDLKIFSCVENKWFATKRERVKEVGFYRRFMDHINLTKNVSLRSLSL